MTGRSQPPEPERNFLAISDSASLFVPIWKQPTCLEYFMGMIRGERPVIVFVGAANGDCAFKQAMFYALAKRLAFRPRVLSLFALEDDRPETFFAGADAIYIDGGSTRNLLALMREWKADKALAQAYHAGVPIAGASAGANLMFEWGMTDSVRTRIDPLEGMGLIPGTISVHHLARPDRAKAFADHMAQQADNALSYTLKDGQLAHYRNEELFRSIET